MMMTDKKKLVALGVGVVGAGIAGWYLSGKLKPKENGYKIDPVPVDYFGGFGAGTEPSTGLPPQPGEEPWPFQFYDELPQQPGNLVSTGPGFVSAGQQWWAWGAPPDQDEPPPEAQENASLDPIKTTSPDTPPPHYVGQVGFARQLTLGIERFIKKRPEVQTLAKRWPNITRLSQPIKALLPSAAAAPTPETRAPTHIVRAPTRSEPTPETRIRLLGGYEETYRKTEATGTDPYKVYIPKVF